MSDTHKLVAQCARRLAPTMQAMDGAQALRRFAELLEQEARRQQQEGCKILQPYAGMIRCSASH